MPWQYHWGLNQNTKRLRDQKTVWYTYSIASDLNQQTYVCSQHTCVQHACCSHRSLKQAAHQHVQQSTFSDPVIHLSACGPKMAGRLQALLPHCGRPACKHTNKPYRPTTTQNPDITLNPDPPDQAICRSTSSLPQLPLVCVVLPPGAAAAATAAASPPF